MADFVAVLKKTLDGLGETTPETRQRVYEKARATISAKLAALNPPPPPAVADKQKRALEDAIAAVEKEFVIVSDPLAELEDVFASLKNPQPKVLSPQPAPRPESWSRATPSVQTPSQPPAPPPLAAEPVTAPLGKPMFAPLPDADPADDSTLDHHVTPDDGGHEVRRKRSYGGLVVAALVLAVIGGGAYGVWLNRDAFGGLFGSASQDVAATPPVESTPEPTPEPEEAPASTPAEVPAESAGSDTPKFTQRLTPEGAEEDPGPAGGGTSLGEGTSIAAVTQPPTLAPATPAAPVDPAASEEDPDSSALPDGETPPESAEGTPPAETIPPAETTPPAATETAAAEPAPDAALAVGQKAIFYEERTNTTEGSAEPGSIVWSLVQESPGADLPPEPAIRAEATIPGKDLQLRMTVRRNADRTLPASHIIEMIFLTPQGFEGGGIDNILRVAMKGSEQEAGSPLIGIPAKIADGFFLVALNDTKPEIDANLSLLRRQSWIDVPVVYKTGRRALFTMEKGIPGEKVFDEAIKAWQAASTTGTAAPG